MQESTELLIMGAAWLTVVIPSAYGLLNPLFKKIDRAWDKIKGSKKSFSIVMLSIVFLPIVIVMSMKTNEMQVATFGVISGFYISYFILYRKIA